MGGSCGETAMERFSFQKESSNLKTELNTKPNITSRPQNRANCRRYKLQHEQCCRLHALHSVHGRYFLFTFRRSLFFIWAARMPVMGKIIVIQKH
jgi:hypothetical protein